MNRPLKLLLVTFFATFAIDQIIKQIILGGARFDSDCISTVLVFNEGVAFSMFAFLEEWLKFIQLGLILYVAYWFYTQKEYFEKYYIEAGLILAGGVSNNLDRFVHGGVVDYVYYHCGFDFAIFNYADVMIDLGAGLIVLKLLRNR